MPFPTKPDNLVIMRALISSFFLLVASAAHAQLPAPQFKFIDSVENVVNANLKKYSVKKDTGRIVVSKNQTASYQKQFFMDRRTNTLNLVTYLRMFNNGLLINETYYYLHNKPLSIYRLKQARRKSPQEESYYFYNDQTYTDSTTLPRTNEIRTKAEGFLSEYKKLK